MNIQRWARTPWGQGEGSNPSPVIHTDEAETRSVSSVEAKRQNAPALDEAGATASANTEDNGTPELTTMT